MTQSEIRLTLSNLDGYFTELARLNNLLDSGEITLEEYCKARKRAKKPRWSHKRKANAKAKSNHIIHYNVSSDGTKKWGD